MAAGGICGALYKCTGTQRSVLVVFFHALGLTNPSYSRSQARVRRCDLNDYGSRSLELGQVGHPLVLFSVYVLTFISGLTTTKASERGFVYHYSGSPNTDITFTPQFHQSLNGLPGIVRFSDASSVATLSTALTFGPREHAALLTARLSSQQCTRCL